MQCRVEEGESGGPPYSCHSAESTEHMHLRYVMWQEEVVALLRQESKGAPVRIPAPRRRVRVTLLTCST
jgi:hypothetical protein